jgi:hypothetical protein
MFNDFVEGYYDNLDDMNECGITCKNLNIPIPEYKCFYTEELQKKVFNYFKTDFERFGYDYNDI